MRLNKANNTGLVLFLFCHISETHIMQKRQTFLKTTD